MKHYNPLLADQVRSKLTGDCVTAIVTEAFCNALPFSADELRSESDKLAGYAINVVKAMHPETLMSRALESADSSNAQDYLQALESELSIVVEGATQRVLNNLSDASPVPEVIKQAKLDEKDVEKFANAGQKVGVNAVAKLVKDKMLDMIKSERESYENAEKLRSEVRDAIQEEKDSVRDSLEADDDEKFIEAPVNKDPTPEAEESVVDDQAAPVEDEATLESYLNVVLAPNEPRNHVSVFSKLQDICMESILHTGEVYDTEVPYATMEKITLESTFPFFDLTGRPIENDLRSLQVGLEATTAEDADEEALQQKMKATAKTAFISTVCIMTLLEVLKTMHLAKPTTGMVKNFVDTQTELPDTVTADLDRIENKVDAATGEVKKSVAMGAMSAVETLEAKESLTSIRDTLQNMQLPQAAQESQTRIVGKLTAAIEASLEIPERHIRTDSRSARIKEDNISNLNYAIKMLSRKPAVESVQICLDSRTPMGDDRNLISIEAQGLDAHGYPVANYSFDFHAAQFMGDSIGEAVMECAQYCEFKKAPKATKIKYTNEGYSVPLEFQ